MVRKLAGAAVIAAGFTGFMVFIAFTAVATAIAEAREACR